MTFSPLCWHFYLFPPLWNRKWEYLQTFEDIGSLHVTLKMYLMPVKQKLCAVVWLVCCISILLAMRSFYARNKMKCNTVFHRKYYSYSALLKYYIWWHWWSEDYQWNNTWKNLNTQNESYELLLLWIVQWGRAAQQFFKFLLLTSTGNVTVLNK